MRTGPQDTDQRPVLVFDSGIGGVTVACEIRRLMPAVPLVYVADDAGFPYGNWAGEDLARHCVDLVVAKCRDLDPVAVVIACNTASTLVLAPLRAVLQIPVVGTVPAIKPAAEQSRSGMVSILATPATVTRDYTFDLIRRYAPRTAVTLVGAPRLAALAEDQIAGRVLDLARLTAEIRPCFQEGNDNRTDIVVLACTHFPLLRAALEQAAPWPVTWLDPAPAIARRLHDVLSRPPQSRTVGWIDAQSTSGDPLPHVLSILAAASHR